MVERKPNDIKIVAWLLVAKKLIKFANDETSYKINDNVMSKSNFDTFPLKKGDNVEVAITDGVVTYLRKQKSTEPKGSEEAYEPTPEAKTEEKPVSSLGTEDSKTIQILTVFAVAANKKVVKFLEVKDNGWYQIAPEIQAQDYATIGLIAKNKVQVTFNDKTVISLVKVASEAPQQEKTTTSSPANAKSEPMAGSAVQTPSVAPTAKKEWKPFSTNKDDYWTKKFELDQIHYDVKESEKQISIEAQAAVNAANEVAGRVASTISPAPTANIINNMILAIAESNYSLIQELKKK